MMLCRDNRRNQRTTACRRTLRRRTAHKQTQTMQPEPSAFQKLKSVNRSAFSNKRLSMKPNQCQCALQSYTGDNQRQARHRFKIYPT